MLRRLLVRKHRNSHLFLLMTRSLLVCRTAFAPTVRATLLPALPCSFTTIAIGHNWGMRCWNPPARPVEGRRQFSQQHFTGRRWSSKTFLFPGHDTCRQHYGEGRAMGNIASSRTLDAKVFKKQVIHAPVGPKRMGRPPFRAPLLPRMPMPGICVQSLMSGMRAQTMRNTRLNQELLREPHASLRSLQGASSAPVGIHTHMRACAHCCNDDALEARGRLPPRVSACCAASTALWSRRRSAQIRKTSRATAARA